MFRFIQCLAALTAVLLASCAAKRTPFSPDGPPTVGMPSELSDRERQFMPDIDSALRREGLLPVRNGRGDMQLEFKIAEGPINTDTNIALNEGDTTLATGYGRAAGVPMIGRSSVAEKSFSAAFAEFSSNLSGTASQRGWNSSASSFSGGDEPTYSEDGQLPVY
jgi:hypothetical protein